MPLFVRSSWAFLGSRFHTSVARAIGCSYRLPPRCPRPTSPSSQLRPGARSARAPSRARRCDGELSDESILGTPPALPAARGDVCVDGRDHAWSHCQPLPRPGLLGRFRAYFNVVGGLLMLGDLQRIMSLRPKSQ